MLNAAARRNTRDVEKEDRAMAAGARLSAGALTLEDLLAISDWKSSRPRWRIRTNDSVARAAAVKIVQGSGSGRTKAEALKAALAGVDIRMASAILAAARVSSP